MRLDSRIAAQLHRLRTRTIAQLRLVSCNAYPLHPCGRSCYFSKYSSDGALNIVDSRGTGLVVDVSESIRVRRYKVMSALELQDYCVYLVSVSAERARRRNISSR